MFEFIRRLLVGRFRRLRLARPRVYSPTLYMFTLFVEKRGKRCILPRWLVVGWSLVGRWLVSWLVSWLPTWARLLIFIEFTDCYNGCLLGCGHGYLLG